MSDSILDLTTALAPAEIFTVDGEEYHLLGLDHLNAEEEASVMGYFAKFRGLQEKYEATEDEKVGADISKLLIVQRVKILSALTDMPKDVCAKLPVSAQAKLLKHLEQMINPDGE